MTFSSDKVRGWVTQSFMCLHRELWLVLTTDYIFRDLLAFNLIDYFSAAFIYKNHTSLQFYRLLPGSHQSHSFSAELMKAPNSKHYGIREECPEAQADATQIHFRTCETFQLCSLTPLSELLDP